MNRARALDGGLAVVVLFVAVAAGVGSAATLSVPGVAAGALLSFCVEWLLARWRARVRAVWERPGVRVVSLLVALALILVLVRTAPSVGLSVVGGAAAGYLLVLAAVELGLVSVPGGE